MSAPKLAKDGTHPWFQGFGVTSGDGATTLCYRDREDPRQGFCWRLGATEASGIALLGSRGAAEAAAKLAQEGMIKGSAPFRPEHITVTAFWGTDERAPSAWAEVTEQAKVLVGLWRPPSPSAAPAAAVAPSATKEIIKAILKRLARRAAATRALVEIASITDMTRTMMAGKAQGLALALEIVASEGDPEDDET